MSGLAAGFNPHLYGSDTAGGGLELTAGPAMTCSPDSSPGFPDPGALACSLLWTPVAGIP